MKNFFFSLFFLGIGFQFLNAQSIFEKYQNNSDVSYVSISPTMFKMLGQMSISTDDPEAQQFLELVNSIKNFEVLISENQKITSEMLAWADNQVKKQKLEVLMTVKDKETDVNFYVKSGATENKVEQLLMLVKDKSSGKNSDKLPLGMESVLLFMEGDIDLNQISKLTENMDLPGGDQLNKAAKNKSL